jgi:hypothetical protein
MIRPFWDCGRKPRAQSASRFPASNVRGVDMSTATLNLSIMPKRMLSKREAAHYCGLPLRHFERICPVKPVSLGDRLLWDIRDLDVWLDSLKAEEQTMDAIVARLA